MFSGIIEQVGLVRDVVAVGPSRLLTLDTGFVDLTLGESVAVNGVCLTVTRHDGAGGADFFISPETLERSNLSVVTARTRVNLERSVTLATRLSGHLVQGHVDGKAWLSAVVDAGDARQLTLTLPEHLRGYCVEKGSIALNGISLTLNGVGQPGEDRRFSVAITLIPHTWTHTNLQHCVVGDEINVEVDVLAKYVETLCRAYLKP